jgi:hypothetical protein
LEQQNIPVESAMLYLIELLHTNCSHPNSMSLSEGTCLCLLLGIVALILAIKNITTYQMVPVPLQVPIQVCGASSAPGSTLTAEEERERLEAQLEAQHREEWCRKFEEEEVERRFREKFCQHEYNRQYDEAEKLKEENFTLRDLIWR